MSKIDKIKRLAARVAVKARYRRSNRDPRVWIFGEWFGKKCNDSSLHLANYMAAHHPELTLCWIARKGCVGLEDLDSRVRRVEMNSAEAKKLLTSAGAVFVNEGLQDLWENGYNYCSGAVVVNLWHGVPWKRIGLDSYRPSERLARTYAKLIYALQGFSYFPTSSAPCSRALISGFGVKEENLIPSGLPRNEIFFDGAEVARLREKILSQLQNLGLNVGASTKIITYMPTFRDKSAAAFDFGAMEERRALGEILEAHNAVIVQKAHIVSQMRAGSPADGSRGRIITWNDCSAQELMAASDMLITDYSSCFFDFLLLDRPIIHYLYDYEYYAHRDRGLYFPKEDVVCGDAPETEAQLLDAIRSGLEDPGKDRALRQKRREEFLTYESPDSCRIIADFIMQKLAQRKEDPAV